MLEFILNSLNNCLSHDASLREKGQKDLESQTNNSSFIPQLVLIASDNNIGIGERQLAAVYLKNTIESTWNLCESKEHVKKQLLLSLQEPQKTVQSNIVIKY